MSAAIVSTLVVIGKEDQEPPLKMSCRDEFVLGRACNTKARSLSPPGAFPALDLSG